MIRRVSWLAAGIAVGAGGSLWARRRFEMLSDRLKSGELSTDIVNVAGRGASAGAARLRRAVEEGRVSARTREDRLWHELEVRARGA